MRQRRYRAVSLAEYAIPVALVALAGITALSLMGASARDVLNWMGDSIKYQPVMTSQAGPVETSQAVTPSVSSPIASIQEKPLTSVDIQALKEATEGYMPSFNETRQALDSTGANGATLEVLQRLETLIPIWEAQNAITSEGADIIRQLAQSGYQVAANQAMLENAFIHNQDVTYGDKTYTLYEAAQLHGLKNTVRSLELSQNAIESLDPKLSSGVLDSFLQLYSQAALSEALQNPIVKEQVSTLVKQIITVDDSLGWSVDSLSSDSSVQNNNRMNVLKQSVSNNFSNLSGSSVSASASEVSTASSAAICKNSKAKKCK